VAARDEQGGLSVQTLIIASVSSLVAAIVVHEVWQGGAILGAAITPVIVALTSEGLKKPTQRITAIREERVARTGVRSPAAPPPPELERADPFGIWQEEPRRSARLGGHHWKLALATGVVAFALAAFVLTGSELVFGGPVGTGGKKTTLFGGKSKHRRQQEREPAQTTPGQAAPAPATTAPAETVPPAQTTPAPPAQTAPAETTPGVAPTVPPDGEADQASAP
jgi:hypothetical protein